MFEVEDFDPAAKPVIFQEIQERCVHFGELQMFPIIGGHSRIHILEGLERYRDYVFRESFNLFDEKSRRAFTNQLSPLPTGWHNPQYIAETLADVDSHLQLDSEDETNYDRKYDVLVQGWVRREIMVGTVNRLWLQTPNPDSCMEFRFRFGLFRIALTIFRDILNFYRYKEEGYEELDREVD
jgi:hypothetical protein